jgi:hypothetical protein
MRQRLDADDPTAATIHTSALKRQQIRQFGYADQRMSDYEEDHLVPLGLGGSPDQPAQSLARAKGIGRRLECGHEGRARGCADPYGLFGPGAAGGGAAAIATDWIAAIRDT